VGQRLSPSRIGLANSRRVLAENVADVGADEIWKMTLGNAVNYFHLTDG
jgi:hypothetical protein